MVAQFVFFFPLSREFGASIFLFGCRTYVFVELGILICAINIMALLYSMGFLAALMKVMGPLPFDDAVENSSQHRLHRWDLKALYRSLLCKDRRERRDDELLEDEDPHCYDDDVSL